MKDTQWLAWVASLMGTASRQRHTAMLPPDQFHCLLDELPIHLIPARALDREGQCDPVRQPWRLNPDCSVLPPGEIPRELQSHKNLLEGFYLGCSVAWVREPRGGGLLPFWLGPGSEEAVTKLREGESASALSENIKLILASAGILIPEDRQEHSAAQWSEIVTARAETFRNKDYAPIANLIHPFHIAALRRYYRQQIRRGVMHLGDEQSSRRYVAHNESVARYFHHHLTKIVSAIVGDPIKRSYVYLASYMGGAELKKHVDRAQCEFSVTLCLDFSPEPDFATPWPIRLDTPEGTVTIYQALGDALVYRGTKVPHFRNVLGNSFTSTSIFFHYVRADFSGSLN
jgi:hypothetical protein